MNTGNPPLLKKKQDEKDPSDKVESSKRTTQPLSGILKSPISTVAGPSPAATIGSNSNQRPQGSKVIRFAMYADTRKFTRHKLDNVIELRNHLPTTLKQVKRRTPQASKAFRRNPEVQYHSCRRALNNAFQWFRSIHPTTKMSWEDFFCIGHRSDYRCRITVVRRVFQSRKRILADNMQCPAFDVERLPFRRRFVLDTGASFHLISKNSLTPI